MEGAGAFCGSLSRVKPYLAMVSLQFGYAGLHIVTMLCLKNGMSHYVLVVYRHAVATLVIAPFALVVERKVRPKMTISTFLKIMVMGLLEPVIDQNLYYVGLTNTSATFTSALYNILPAVTFIMAIIFRLEKVKIKKLPSQAKIIGTVLTMVGAMVMTVYKGPILNFLWSMGHAHHEAAGHHSANHNFIKGTFMLIASCTGWSAFFILQSFTLKAYPAELSLTALMCLLGTVQGAAVALVMERGAHAWSVGWDTRLLAPVYSGVVCSGLAYYMQGTVIKERGPVFVTAFNPLNMVIVAVLGSFILGEQVTVGRLIGALTIVIGLYCVVWGKSKDPLESTPSMDKKNGALELPTTMTDDVKANGNDHLSGGIVVVDNPAKDTLSMK